MTEDIKLQFLATVASYGGSFALRCLALAFRSMPSIQATVCPPYLARHAPADLLAVLNFA